MIVPRNCLLEPGCLVEVVKPKKDIFNNKSIHLSLPHCSKCTDLLDMFIPHPTWLGAQIGAHIARFFFKSLPPPLEKILVTPMSLFNIFVSVNKLLNNVKW